MAKLNSYPQNAKYILGELQVGCVNELPGGGFGIFRWFLRKKTSESSGGVKRALYWSSQRKGIMGRFQRDGRELVCTQPHNQEDISDTSEEDIP